MHNRTRILRSAKTGPYVESFRRDKRWDAIVRACIDEGYCMVSYVCSSTLGRHACVFYLSPDREREMVLWDGNGAAWTGAFFYGAVGFRVGGEVWEAIDSLFSRNVHGPLLESRISASFVFGRGHGWCALVSILIGTLIRDAMFCAVRVTLCVSGIVQGRPSELQ